ncbi:MAG: PorP/SprF family type IX secretion system membrane protein, partial [Bacteroidota bacterium]|nr:PorP/SprF family type IX secretion system membrane protein [Bacteroidota bacterium]
MRNSIIKFALALLASSPAIAQQLPFSSQYYTNPFVINPALTGTKETVNAFLTHRSQWTGMAGAPQTSYLTIDGPVEAKNIGLGLKLYSDVTDITSKVGAFANYSYKLKINDDNNLYFGLALGVINNRIDFSKAVVRDKDDPFLSTTAQSRTVFS